MRHLIDQATLDSLEGIKRHVKRTTTHPQEQPNKSDLEERFRSDTQLPYEAKIRSAGYSDVDVNLFQDAWRSMIAEDLE